MGFHVCELCNVYRHGRNAMIPGRGCIYYVPVMISHYIGVHFYKPPQEFLDAVMACPEMNSTQYFEALVANYTQDWCLRFMNYAPCPYCDGQKTAPRARQCSSCGMDWHGEPYNARPGSEHDGSMIVLGQDQPKFVRHGIEVRVRYARSTQPSKHTNSLADWLWLSSVGVVMLCAGLLRTLFSLARYGRSTTSERHSSSKRKRPLRRRF